MAVSLSYELVRLLDRFNNLVVARATAKIAHHPILDLVLSGSRILVEQSLGSNHLTRSADAALKTAVLDEALLHRMELAVLRQTLNCRDLVPIGHDRERDTRTDHFIIHQHRAGAADSNAASLLGAGQTQVVTQTVDQQSIGRNLKLMLFAIHAQFDFLLHRGPFHTISKWFVVMRISTGPNL